MLEDFRLRTFLKVAECGSFTAAAGELGISQPAVSQSIGSLEKSLGVTLLTRTRGMAFLTAEGMAFKEYASRILYWYRAADSMFGPGGRLTDNRPVRIAADSVSAAYLIPSAISTLHATRPELAFSIVDTGYASSDLTSGGPEGADVRISISPIPETMDFEGEGMLVGVMDAAVIASGLNKSVAHAADAALKPFSTLAGIHVSNRFALWQGYEPLLSPDIMARVSVVSSSVEAVKTMVAKSHNLVGIVPEPALRGGDSAELLKMPVQLPDFTCDVHFAPDPDFAAKTVCAILRDALETVVRN